MSRFDVLIVGSGHGGAQAAIALRQRGFKGSIAIVGDDAEPPYERPPLTKDYLAGDKPFERILIRPVSFWAERRIDLVANTRIVDVSASDHTVRDASGSVLTYGTLVWAAGGHPRALNCDGAHLSGIHGIRTRANADRLSAEIQAATHVAVVGAGYIGLETAAVLRKLGKRVTVLELQDRVLARVAGRLLSSYVETEHRAQGVDIRLGVGVQAVTGRQGRVCAIELSDGSTLPADLVVVGIGIVPSVAPLLAAGAIGGNGVGVDEHCRTSLPDVYAIGDCALHANAFAPGPPIRLESVQNATEMAETVAKALTSGCEPYGPLPWFWSHQYDLRLQTLGISVGHDQEVLRGNPDDRRFSVVYLRQGHVIALDCVNAVRDYAGGRALVAGRVKVDPRLLADPSIALKELSASAE